ncbi:glutathione S-transferase family protein [Paraburkholderia kururiensis]|uniref:glutathione S-transferase family protein n=1 Tax=Paraburkholderia kururiensis TaxID=984307 RepID=UPI00037BECC2|nr:glutathione S-transferase family protein [Paraburkholderia kururiensis]
MQLSLFHVPGACSRVTLTALEMSGAPYEVIVVPFHRGGLADPAFRAISPCGQVPALSIDGRTLTENAAILWTLAQMFPGRGLFPSTTDLVAQGEAMSRLVFCSSQLHPIVSRIASPQRTCDLSAEAVACVRSQAIATMLERLGVLHDTLANRPWWLGEDFSIADVYLGWITNRLRLQGVALDTLPAVQAHRDRVAANPTVQRVLSHERELVSRLEADGSVISEQLRRMLE